MINPQGAVSDDRGPRVSLVTNVTEFAGPGSALGLLNSGHKVYAHDPRFGDSAPHKTIAGIIAVPGTREEVLAEVLRREGRIDTLVENPTIRGERYVTEDANTEKLDGWLDDAARELITEPFKLLNRVSKHMNDHEGGAIILVTSESWMKPQRGSVYYSAMRAALPSLALGSARDVAPKVQVNCLSLNYLQSEEYYPAAIWSTPEKLKELAERVPVGRLNTDQDLAKVVAFLASASTPFLTGSTIKVDGAALV
ncbi:MAG: SDR family oxidoreductase [Segniliparus sp.]|uniref:SDR family oxidoreductase n=1 Tax=Segniliparus sp. TaxID=2804064 RepID=UPI003F2B6C43